MKDRILCQRNASAAYELAVASGRPYQPGDQVTYYVTGTKKNVRVFENAKNASEWEPDRPDENIEYYAHKLEALYKKYGKEGFAVLGFPSNQFGEQEPGPESEIAEFCEMNFGVTFPLFAKIDVNGESAHPLFKHLTKAKPGLLGSEAIKWNFTKFLVDRHGKVVKRYAPTTEPKEIASDIDKLLAAK